jgi:hypothetical protein
MPVLSKMTKSFGLNISPFAQLPVAVVFQLPLVPPVQTRSALVLEVVRINWLFVVEWVSIAD